MKKYLSTAGAAAVAALLAAAAPAHATLSQFAFVGQLPLTYNGANATNSLTTTTVGGDATTLTFALGTDGATAFPSGIPVNVVISGDRNGTLVTYPGVNPTSGAQEPYLLNYYRLLDNVSITITATSNVSVNGRVVVTAGENILSASDLNATIFGAALKPGSMLPAHTSVPAGVTFAMDDPDTTAAGDFTSSLFDFNPGGDDVVESSFTFTDSSKVGVLTNAGTAQTPVYRLSGFAQGNTVTKSFAPNGNFSSDPEPVIDAVPEPASWALMLVGFGGLGAVLRRRRVALAA